MMEHIWALLFIVNLTGVFSVIGSIYILRSKKFANHAKVAVEDKDE